MPLFCRFRPGGDGRQEVYVEKADSLEDLESVFSEWRRDKRHPTEPVPDALLERARRAAAVHGDRAVARTTKLEPSRLWRRRIGQAANSTRRPSSSPACSRLDLSAPTSTDSRPLAEIETPEGIKLRVFAETPEVLKLLASALGARGRP